MSAVTGQNKALSVMMIIIGMIGYFTGSDRFLSLSFFFVGLIIILLMEIDKK